MAEIIFALSFLALVFVIFLQSLKVKFLLGNGIVAAGFFPRILTVLLIILLLYYLFTLVRKRKPAQTKQEASLSGVWRQCFLIGSLFLSLWLGEFLGMILTTGLFLLANLVVVQRLSWRKALIFSISASVLFYLIFDFALGLNLPNGILG